MAEYRDSTHLTETEMKSINLLAEAIRHKMYGIDVRESIALAIELMLDIFSKENNDAVAEIIKARNEFGSLDDRLDNMLVDMQNISVSQINKNLGKIDQTYLTDELIAQIAGTDAINAVPANDSLTTEKYADDSVTAKKTNFFEETVVNLFDKTKTTSGILQASTGTIAANELYFATDYIPVEVDKSYSRTEKLDGAWYDQNKKYLSSVGYNQTITAPSSAKFVRLTFSVSKIDTTMVVNSDTIPIQYLPFGDAYINFAGENRVRSISQQLSPYIKPIPKYQKLKWGVLGDSLTEVNASASKRYHDYVAEDLGFTVLNYGVGGTGYKRGDSTSTSFYNRIESMDSSLQVITIFGSLNDCNAIANGTPLGNVLDATADTVAGAINLTLEKLNAKFPTIPIGIITPTPWHTSVLGDSSNVNTQYVEMLIAIAKKRGLPILDLYNTSGLRPWDVSYRALMYSHDNGAGVHIDENGHKFISPKVSEFMKTLI